jgi:uncharacterized membrane protein YfcA
MDVLQLLILAVLGLLGGVLSGLVGVGGGSVFVPALVYAADWQIKDAVAASLVIIVFSSLSGTLRNARSENPVNWRVAMLLASTVAPSSLIGVAISKISPQTVVEVVFATLLMALSYPMFRGGPAPTDTPKKMPLPLVLLAGAGAGALAGLVGIGGAIVLVPLISLGWRLPTKTAISTSLAVVLFAGTVGAAGYIVSGFEDLLSLPPLIVGSILGAWLGVRLRDLTPEAVIQRGFAVFMVVIALRMLAGAAGIF